MTGYSVSIATASKELTAKERIQLKDTTSAIKLDEITQTESIIIHPAMYAELDIHNEMSDNKDYKNYIVVDVDGTKYVTGSSSFWTSFMDIASEMENETEEWAIKVYRMPSKNYKGKEFITCSIE
jgi:hypothetical protein